MMDIRAVQNAQCAFYTAFVLKRLSEIIKSLLGMAYIKSAMCTLYRSYTKYKARNICSFFIALIPRANAENPFKCLRAHAMRFSVSVSRSTLNERYKVVHSITRFVPCLFKKTL